MTRSERREASAGREGGSTNFFILRFGSRFSSVVCARSECPSWVASRDPWCAVVSDFCEISRKTFPKPIAILFALWYNSARVDIREYVSALCCPHHALSCTGIVMGAFSKKQGTLRVTFRSLMCLIFCLSLTFIFSRLKTLPARRAHDRTHGTAERSARGILLLDI